MRFLRILVLVLAFYPAALHLRAAEDDRPAHEQELDSAQWGHLEMRFVFDGVPPKPRAIAKPFGAPLAVDESLLVDAQDRGIANVAVWLRHDSRQGELHVHPSYRKAAAKGVAIGIVGDALVPRVTMVRTTQRITVTNADPHGHNIRAHVFDNAPFNHLVLAGESIQTQFPKPESPPIRLDDVLHPWLTGYVHVGEHPYHAVSSANGKLLISNVPKGKWTFVVWHERAGYVKEAEVGGKPVKWDRGCLQLEIQSGRNDLGEVKLAPSIFKE